MILWLDAQLSPLLATWLRWKFSLEVSSLRDLGLRDAEDLVIFQATKDAGAVAVTKDADFLLLLE